MRNKIFRLIFNVIFWCLPLAGFAQTYPIYVMPTLTPPYSLTLSDYIKPGAQNLVVTVMVNDVSITNLPVRLHLKIETTAGVTIENIPVMTTTPLYLSGGQVNVLFGDDLTDYFNVNNLQFKGYSREEYRRTGQLPEGFYRFTVEVRHFNTGRLISNQGSIMAWIALGKPPLLKNPLEGAEMGTIAGMPLTFSWQPASLGVPNAGLQYTFEMWEMRVPGISPYVVAASMPVFHSTTQTNTTLVLHPSSLFFEPGMQYAWRVTASDPAGLIPFAENGQSEIRTFIYQSKCDCVNDFTINQRGRDATIQWKSASNQTSFYVEVENPDTDYYNRQQVFNNRLDLHGLEAGKTYNIRVQAVCNNNEENSSDFTAWKTLSIAENKPIQEDCPDCGCDAKFDENSITNFELRRDLQPGDTIVTANGATRFILESVEQQGDGVYKGLFLFWWEFFRVKILCEYWDLSVNTDNVIVNFDFESVYDPKFLLDVDAAKDYIDNLTETISKGLTTTEIKDSLKISGPIEDIYVDKNGDVVIVNGNDTTRLDNNFNGTLIQGEDGKEYVATSNGKVMGVDEYKATGGNSYKQDEYNKDKESKSEPSVKFTASEDQKYGFDEYTEQKNAIQNDYPELKAGYRPAFKSVASYRTDKVVISGANKNTDFRTEWGVPAASTGSELTIRGGGNGDETILYAYDKQDSTETVTGKLNILSFDEQSKTVYLVRVNDGELPDKKKLEDELNRIYAPAVTKWQVSVVDKVVDVNFPGGVYTHGESSAIAVYNSDQKAVINAFKDMPGNTMEKDALYFFFIKNAKDRDYEGDLAGYMPLGYQSGFIYGKPNEETIAHELAHGAFNLYHTFSDKNYVAAKYTTDNLMDYKGGSELWAHQWKLIHDPQNMWLKFLQDEEEGESILNDVSSIIELIRKAASNKSECTIPIYSHTVIDNVYDISSDRTIKDEIAAIYKGIKFQIIFDENSIEKKVCSFDFNDVEIIPYNLPNPIYDYQSAIDIRSKKTKRALITFNCNKHDLILVQEFLFGDVEKDCNPIIDEVTQKLDKGQDVDLRLISASCAAQISLKTRQKLIDYILNKWFVTEKHEHALLVLIEQVPDNDVDEFIKYLRYNKHGDKFVYQKLISAIDDINGKDYYAALMQVFTRLLLRKSEYANGNTPQLKDIILVAKKPWINITDRPENEFRYAKDPNYNKNGDIEVSYEINVMLDAEIKLGATTIPTFTGQAIYQPINYLNKEFEWKAYDEPYIYDPLSLVFVSSFSETENINSILQEETANGYIVPAVVLMYNKEKVLQQNIEQGVYVGIDAASILISGGTLMYVKAAGQTISKLQKALLILDIANGAINIAVNVTELSENEDIQTILFAYNLGTAGFNLACSTKNINWLRKGGQVLKGTENISETLILRLSKYDETRRIGFFKDFGENKTLLEQLDKISDVEFEELIKHYDISLAKESRISKLVNYLSMYDEPLIISSNSSKQNRINTITEWLRNMGKKNSEINNIIRGKIDLSSSVSVIDLKKGDRVFRFERTKGVTEVDKHFFTTADAADAGVRSVGFSDPTDYQLVTYEIVKDTKVLKTKMNTNYIQYISDELQNNIKIIEIESAF